MISAPTAQMKKDWQLAEGDFNRFLDWLDSDREKAAQEYERLRRKLIRLLEKRGCHLAEDLADETFNRVIRRLQNTPEGIPGTPAAYITAVAKNLHLEYLKGQSRTEPLLDPVHPGPPSSGTTKSGDSDDRASECLEHCLNRLSSEDRRLIERYYQDDKRAKIDNRKLLAEELGLSFNALRIRAHRIRDRLRPCLNECLEREPDS